MLRILLIIIASLTIISCATKNIPILYPVSQIKLPVDPIPSTRSLTSKSSPADVMKTWVATALAYRDWNIIVRKQIENSK